MQAIKHEEVMLELESIRAKRERNAPICPNCATQTIKYYQSPANANIDDHKYPSCMKQVETQTVLLNSLSDLETISSNEIRMLLTMNKIKPRTTNKESNTDYDLLMYCASPATRAIKVDQSVTVSLAIERSDKVSFASFVFRLSVVPQL